MKIAIPIAEGKLAVHFGHCEEFALVEVAQESKEIIRTTMVQPPPHEPGVLPRWLAQQQVQVIVAGGMGQRARDLFTQNNIEVVTGVESAAPEKLVQDYLDRTLTIGENPCDH